MAKGWNRREWLNPNESADLGWIKASVDPGYKAGSVYSELMIGDCSRVITLDFSYDEGDKQQRMEKIDAIIAILQEMKAVMPAMALLGGEDDE